MAKKTQPLPRRSTPPIRHGKPYAPPPAEPAPVARAATPEAQDETPAAPSRPTFDKGDAWPKHPPTSAQYDPTDDR
jgi:hypothetical protein